MHLITITCQLSTTGFILDPSWTDPLGMRMRTSRSSAWVSCIHVSIVCCILTSTYVVLYTRQSVLYKRLGTFPLVHTFLRETFSLNFVLYYQESTSCRRQLSCLEHQGQLDRDSSRLPLRKVTIHPQFHLIFYIPNTNFVRSASVLSSLSWRLWHMIHKQCSAVWYYCRWYQSRGSIQIRRISKEGSC